ncbi:MAG TPA: substrate-binding domain-containing protein [Xanthobacteraceae bacterium]|jgi:molybdate transport system substrate-binding protein|nr:substrate-binding domain-containing protein [Xanthobacteraceae bacterium]
MSKKRYATNAAALLLSMGLVSMGLAVPALANDIHVISTGNIRPALFDLQKEYEQKQGDKLTLSIQGAAATQKLAETGGQGEVVIGPRWMLDALASKDKVKAGSIVDIAHSSVGVVVRAGEALPDISTDENFKKLLLTADSIAYPDPQKGSLGGNLFAALVRDWGIEKEVKAKSMLMDGGAPTGQAVADGKAHFGINQIAELKIVPGLSFLSPLPPALTDKIVMSVGVLSSVKDEKGAAAWITFLSGPAAAPAIKAHGMDPGAVAGSPK